MALWVRTILTTGPRDELTEAVAGHRAHIEELRAGGQLRFAGELAGDEGYVDVFEAADRHQAEAISNGSPLVELGLGAWMLREVTEL